MQPRRSRFGAQAEPPRQRFLPPWVMLTFGLLVVALLYVIFPQKFLLEQVLRRDEADNLSVSYLVTLLKTDPLNSELRFALAEQQFRLGRYADAEVTVQPLVNATNIGERLHARRLQFEALEAAAYALPEGSATREQAIAALVPRLVSLTNEPWDNRSLAAFAEKALALGAKRQALDLYHRLVARASDESPEWVAKTAELTLAQGEYGAAAELYFAAQGRATTRAARRKYFLLGLATLQSANRLHEALDRAEANIGELSDDRDTLIFLLRLARSANRPDVAEKYARQLLRMALLHSLRHMAAIQGVQTVAYRPAESFVRTATGNDMLPFDDEAYTLAYEAFLANRNLPDALRVAEAAVRQRPHDAAWRERLAKVAEWSGKPALALENWLRLAEESGLPAAWQAVLRLAPGLLDDAALLKAQQWQATQGAPSRAVAEKEWRDLAATYERLGQPRAAIDFFQDQYRRRPQRIHLELIADLAERSGNDALALATLDRLAAEFGTTAQLALRQASLLYIQGDLAGAYNRLEAAKKNAGPDAAQFWQVYGDLAQQLQHEDEAIGAYRQLFASGRYRETDLERLVLALRATQPMEAARIAELGWQRFGRPNFLITALDLHTTQGNWERIDQLFAGLAAEQEQELRKDAYFLVLSAQHNRRLGRLDKAEHDWLAALQLNPASASVREGVLWFLIERKDRRQLRRLVAAWRDGGGSVPAEAMAAAYMTLGEPARALAYYRRQLSAKRDDYLWLMAYADALEQAHDPTAAGRVRRHVWQHLRSQPAAAKDLRQREMVARLAQQFAPGDRALALLRQLLRRDQDVVPQPQPVSKTSPTQESNDAALHELALAWALSQEATDLAEAWLVAQYADTVARPGWAELSLALQRDDREALTHILENHADDLPLYDRINAAKRLGRDREAASLAFDGLEKSPADDELHLQLSENLPKQSARMGAAAKIARLGALQERHLDTSIAAPFAPGWRAQAGVEHFAWTSRDQGAIAGLPESGTRSTVAVVNESAQGSIRALLGRRDAHATVTETELTLDRRLGSRMTATIDAGRNLKPTESTPLIVGGAKDLLAGGLTYNIDKRKYLTTRLETNRLYSLERTPLGSGRLFQFEAGYKIRSEYPDYTVRLTGALLNYDADGELGPSLRVLAPANSNPALSFALPEDQRYLSLNFGFGLSLRENYTRALRPFLDLGLSHNSVSGFGYNLVGGISTNVFGSDHLSFYVSTGRGGTGAFSRAQEVGVTYQYFFDRY